MLHLAITGSVLGVLGKFPYNQVEIMGGKFSHKLEVFLPWMLLNRNFLKENRYYPHAGWENFCAKIFPKQLFMFYRLVGVIVTNIMPGVGQNVTMTIGPWTKSAWMENLGPENRPDGCCVVAASQGTNCHSVEHVGRVSPCLNGGGQLMIKSTPTP